MLQTALDFLEKCGVWGLFAATAIEASSLPFPGATFVLIYGYLMDVSTWQLVAISALNSLVYVVFSLIPYYIGKYLGNLTQKKFDEKKVKKAQDWFQKYGEWSITLSRPTGFGNYISYISGISDISVWRFGLLSYLGVFPWNTLLLFIGNYGSLETVERFLAMTRKVGVMITIILVMAAAFILWYYLKKNKEQKQHI
ncbi:VTT domain-containing protein [Thermoactinomyces intermedius]|jgi:membrane protein DedA with SNARE-associated domain|uniref:VTT domain-containing protein n=1 Tax=Thermoactinomyces intermedius TaxID=2024 RepID=A0A8I1ADB5_THEIN|nr:MULTISPECIES: VTT domain-containing protein [Thermoactinomyces]MBA4547798.1 VTT domain-containing protein [Thermoactinomyces intermedius]MBA4836591.1 VTT domain-containing protein [Thermoactinomyces intermedius]MBH8593973.1 VTT domain-containing protein [Thermoactinomyces intermedius]MBH8600020.1 VTT domain-containing protein [Thermoactinomyces sp. CICC 23799]